MNGKNYLPGIGEGPEVSVSYPTLVELTCKLLKFELALTEHTTLRCNLQVKE